MIYEKITLGTVNLLFDVQLPDIHLSFRASGVLREEGCLCQIHSSLSELRGFACS